MDEQTAKQEQFDALDQTATEVFDEIMKFTLALDAPHILVMLKAIEAAYATYLSCAIDRMGPEVALFSMQQVIGTVIAIQKEEQRKEGEQNGNQD